MSNRRPSLIRIFSTVSGLIVLWTISRLCHKTARSGGNAGVYHFKPAQITLGTLLLFAANLLAIPAILRNKNTIRINELSDLRRKEIAWPDNLALTQNPDQKEHARVLSDQLLREIVILPLLWILIAGPRNNTWALILLYAWVHAATYAIYSFSPLGPAFNDKFRPVVYYSSLDPALRCAGNNRNSMYSGHTGNAACATFCLVKFYCDYHPQLRAMHRFMLYSLAATPTLFLGSLRVRALKHFPTDILLAVFIGGSCGVLIPDIYRD